ncbi:phospholipase D1 isoform X1 [Parasteatoda tepidariorum]|uniref:phospholipase D1 isoform X1 n=1 Tax=Parasteatoda tepidariorum TaxID=114398 RepID=UPI001C725F43|nr:phospholipase D1 isoform X1 [Parasteatoda tepidariorum]XP_015910971.2 phospholipase D1 isoform X1 [Parasteatoda tepidariorum]XP_015910972.2 phospholipase D1 isoform X1 [Parasteatoda tepidariorum]XP_015910973.2 phospholipase D1 isoform X1 [Parasteatoda tepidariorum]XP_042905502.1 phospholipase D1 isoform X1 [Parasteatoda tepidariorum]
MADHIALENMDSNITDGDSDYEDLPSPDFEIEEVDESCNNEGLKKMNFSKIHDTPVSFKDPELNMLIPGSSINVKIIDIERSPSTHMINPNLYVLQLQHGPYQWIVKKRYKHFQHLHQQLRLFRTTLSIPIPTKKHKARRKSCRKVEKSRLPRFPKRPDALLTNDKIPLRAQQLEEYLKNVLRIPLYRNHYEMMDFLEICPLSFINDLGRKLKEGLVQKRSGGHRSSTGCFRLKRGFIDWCGRWRWRWLLIKDSWVAYIKAEDGRIRSVLLMDQAFNVECGFLSTGIHHGLQISNLARHLLVRCWTRRRAREWSECLLNAAKTTAHDFTQPNRHSSFVPVRNNNECRWFIDGATYFEAVADALEKAKEEIFIADWWLSPEIYMKRPVIQGEIWRLDHILKRKAQQGVKVFVLLYKEVELALGINSLYSKQQLVNMHPNIKVLRHPDHVTNGTLLWAHHEKIVCIDQSYAFLGGIDLCYGRWDDYQHKLTDLGGVARRISQGTLMEEVKTNHSISETMVQLRRSHSMSEIQVELGAKLSNLRLKLARHSLLPQPPQISIDRSTTDDEIDCPGNLNPVQIQVQSPTPTSSQILTPSSEEEKKIHEPELLEYPTSHLRALDNDECAKKKYTSRKLKAKMVMQAVVRLQGLKKQAHNKSLDSLQDIKCDSLDLPDTDMRRTSSEVALNELGLQGNAKLWIGKDYINFIIKDFEHLHKPYQDLIDRHTTPRMPWHDIGCFVQGAAARDVARHFIQRWNFTKFEKAKYYDRYPWLLPKSYEGCDNIPRLRISSTKKLFCANCQVLRSVSTWSGGIKTMEHSIHTAYLDVIRNAKHYVYIENQFFITQAAGHKDVFNGIGETLYQRILQAHKEKETFRVFVVMPLLPAFEGEIGTGTGTAIQAITHWNYASICRGVDSLYQRLQREVGDPSAYITFYGLRTHDIINEKIVSELVYVHSKLLIADDRTVIIGSANINDRSLLGNRDSEIAMIFEDVDFENAIMDGKPYQAGHFACSLRRTLFREHLGLLDKSCKTIDIRDPVSETFYKEVWIKTAALNTSIYEKVFRCIPSDEVRSFSELKEYLSKPGMVISDPSSASSLLSNVQGHLVLLPFFFLCNENLTPSARTKESLMPVCLWT